MLAIFSTPSSLVVSELSHNIGRLFPPDGGPGVLVDLVGLLIFGAAQYAAIGYLFGAALRWLFSRGKNA
jgi:hypothetical protein